VLRWYERPIAWWRRHPWIPVWVAVALTPAVLLGLRVLDDGAIALRAQPSLVMMIVLLLALVAVAVHASAPRSLPRALVAGGSALVVAAFLVLPMIQVIGQRPCPDRMGTDRGLQVSGQMFDAWRGGARPPVRVWMTAGVAEAWQTRLRGLTVLDYKLEDSGCWERLAPVDTGTTWHEYRVTVRRGDGDRFSKIVTVHTRATRDGWRIADVEGLEP
jgi:hypothetical protein